MACLASTASDSCGRILRIRHLSTKLYQVHTIHQTFSSNTLLHAVSKIQVKMSTYGQLVGRAPATGKRVNNPIQTPRCSHHQHTVDAILPTTPEPFVATREISGDGNPNTSSTRRQRWNQATTDGFCGSTTPGSLEALWESRSRGVDISLFVLTEQARRLRHGQK